MACGATPKAIIFANFLFLNRHSPYDDPYEAQKIMVAHTLSHNQSGFITRAACP
jgi:hypothetical protein